MKFDVDIIDFSKNSDGLIPAVIQDQDTLQVLMVGFMNKAALEQTISSQKVTFYSRSKGRLWQKGETSGNYLVVADIFLDCDQDSLLIMARPLGPTCHSGSISCFCEQELPPLSHLGMVDRVIQERIHEPVAGSYTNLLIERGLTKIAQKVGEEAVEVVIAALAETNDDYLGEMTDLLYHALVLLHAKGLTLKDIAQVIARRHQQKSINP